MLLSTQHGHQVSVCVLRREAGDVGCLHPFWNFRAISWFYSTISSLVLLPSHATLVVFFLPAVPFSKIFSNKLLQYFVVKIQAFLHVSWIAARSYWVGGMCIMLPYGILPLYVYVICFHLYILIIFSVHFFFFFFFFFSFFFFSHVLTNLVSINQTSLPHQHVL